MRPTTDTMRSRSYILKRELYALKKGEVLRNILGVGLAVVIGIGVINFASNKDKGPVNTATQIDTDYSTTNVAQVEAKSDTPTVHHTFTKDPFKLTLTSYGDYNQGGSRFVSLAVNYENISDEPRSSLFYNVTLKDTKGREFAMDEVKSTLVFMSLNPGLSKRGTLTYEVPSDAKIKAIYADGELAWKIKE